MNLSAQSPPCRMNASPLAALARFFFSSFTSPAKTSGGRLETSLRDSEALYFHIEAVV